MSRTFERLSRSAYLTRIPDPRDGRRSLARLIPAGESVLAVAEQIARDDSPVIGALGHDAAVRRRLIELIGQLGEGS
ncbi:hypothetical protein [Amycolatopsis viridis]|uniref:DNA-binding MarR family transcriptional regulator n=1 Tax=Amycolatopsis viridis TaxID=185678 RepID=A0ABX0SYC9_9PSEU|nr:hypothetical protein [Amycolatopsis viridis]NIH81978.1 DNA-binding MarR family transcriptional regulator [Amycolatopsis viridis]